RTVSPLKRAGERRGAASPTQASRPGLTMRLVNEPESAQPPKGGGGTNSPEAQARGTRHPAPPPRPLPRQRPLDTSARRCDLHPQTETEKLVTALREGDRRWERRRDHGSSAESSSWQRWG